MSLYLTLCCPRRCPPGHGDIYSSLLGSGMLDRLIKSGIKYLFVSNSDNLGATLDLDLLAYFASSKKGFVCEVAERTAADKKGGHLAKRKSDGRLVLRESAMCPDDDKSAFEDISKSVLQSVAVQRLINTISMFQGVVMCVVNVHTTLHIPRCHIDSTQRVVLS